MKKRLMNAPDEKTIGYEEIMYSPPFNNTTNNNIAGPSSFTPITSEDFDRAMAIRRATRTKRPNMISSDVLLDGFSTVRPQVSHFPPSTFPNLTPLSAPSATHSFEQLAAVSRPCAPALSLSNLSCIPNTRIVTGLPASPVTPATITSVPNSPKHSALVVEPAQRPPQNPRHQPASQTSVIVIDEDDEDSDDGEYDECDAREHEEREAMVDVHIAKVVAKRSVDQRPENHVQVDCNPSRLEDEHVRKLTEEELVAQRRANEYVLYLPPLPEHAHRPRTSNTNRSRSESDNRPSTSTRSRLDTQSRAGSSAHSSVQEFIEPLVEDRVEIEWGDGDGTGPVFAGKLNKRMNDRSTVFVVFYDDGDKHRTDLNDRRWRLEGGRWVEPGELAEVMRSGEDSDFSLKSGGSKRKGTKRGRKKDKRTSKKQKRQTRTQENEGQNVFMTENEEDEGEWISEEAGNLPFTVAGVHDRNEEGVERNDNMRGEQGQEQDAFEDKEGNDIGYMPGADLNNEEGAGATDMYNK